MQFTVDQLKTRLDKYLATQLPDVSRSHIQHDIEHGLVTHLGKIVTESKTIVRIGDTIAYTPSVVDKLELRAENIPLSIVYNQHDVVVIDKPAGMVMHPGAGFTGTTLASALLYHFEDIKEVGEPDRPGIVHRLDKDTSGLVVVARTQKMYEYLKNEFASRNVKKEYTALVLGHFPEKKGLIDLSIGQSKSDFRKQTCDPTDFNGEALQALTEFWVLEDLDEFSLVKVQLYTGRTHQIRVHFKALGHPLAGDSLYGGAKVKIRDLDRQFLHASSVAFTLPSGERVELTSPLPNDLQKIINRLHGAIDDTPEVIN